MYDILVVGAGISAGTLCEKLKRRYKICVLDVRDHLGGNCYDYASQGGRVHAYGPHIFHCPIESLDVLEFIRPLGRYGWSMYDHRIEAEIKHDGKLIRTPFPYSKQTDKVLGKKLTEDEVLDLYFKGYSKKMWNVDFDELPATIKGRVPKDTQDFPKYFPNQFVGFPIGGYTPMLEDMFDGCDIILRAEETLWTKIPAKQIVYCGRLDRVPNPANGFPFGSTLNHLGKDFDANWLEYKTLDIRFRVNDAWDAKAAVLNFCHTDTPVTRITHYGELHASKCNIQSIETPRGTASVSDLNPFYPFPTRKNLDRVDRLRALIKSAYPNIHLLGRLAQYKYIDMFQAIGAGLKLAEDLEKELSGSNNSVGGVLGDKL